MDSLRYWVTEMHVDGFRFDLASALARSMHDVDRLSAFFDVVHQDPVVSQVKLIAEPWDVGEGGYQVGNFPPPWTEWNGKYRDTVRDVWAGAQVGVRDLAYRLTGSSDLYRSDGRRPFASHQLRHRPRRLHHAPTWSPTSTSATRPTARTTGTARATTGNWNCGVEGEHRRPGGDRAARPAGAQPLATLLLSTGVPMLTAGDELGRTQRRQQQRLLPGQRGLLAGLGGRRQPSWRALALTRRLVALRRELPGAAPGGVLRRPAGARRRRPQGPGLVRPDGEQLTDRDWFAPACRRSACTWTARASGTATRAAGGSSTTRTCWCCTPGPRTPRRAARAPWATAGSWWWPPTYPDGLPPAGTDRPAGGLDLPLTGRSAVLLRAVRGELVGAPPAPATPPGTGEPPPGTVR